MEYSAGVADSCIDELRASLQARSSRVEVAIRSSPSHPDLVMFDPERGLLAVDVHDQLDGDGRTQFVGLNRRIEALRADIGASDDLPIARVLAIREGVTEPTVGIAKRVIVPISQLADAAWLQLIGSGEVDETLLDDARAVLFPTIVFTANLRHGISDEGAAARAEYRVVLDEQQADIAAHDMSGALVLTGPPGSGKTLVLAARARRLAAEHPDWRIQLLCYNTTLVPYLRRLVSDAPNVKVSRIWEIASEFGIRFSYDDDDQSLAERLKAAQKRGLARSLDAVLIDEAQDFRRSWLEIAHALVKPDRGGLMLAGDTAQAIYRDGALQAFLDTVTAEHLQLDVPYRSTRQILTALRNLDPSFDVGDVDDAPEGLPVELVWAQSWDEQAKCVAFEVNHMITAGGLEPRDVGVLVTKYSGTYGRIQREFAECGIPYSALEKREKDEFDLLSNTVKLLTVHSAKGFEFKAVVLFGLEALPDPDAEDPETQRRARVAFVGATRAMDSLLITYTRDNRFLERLSSDPEYVSRYCWPDDYEGVSCG